MTDPLVCWKCGTALADLSLPLSRFAECPTCRAYLHACRLCVSYDTRLSRRCCEQDAEEVTDKERANFCAYFKARPGAYRAGSEARIKAARAKLGDLFSAARKTDPKPES